MAGERFATVMGKLDPRVDIDVPDRLGDQPTRHVELALPKLTAFRVSDVIEAVPQLHALWDLAGRLAKTGDADAARQVESRVGPGRLARALRGEPASVPASEPAFPAEGSSAETTPDAEPSAATTGDPVDAIFGRAEVAPPSTASEVKSGLDAFIGAMRSAGVSSATRSPDRAAAKSAAETIREAVRATAQDILASGATRRLEVAWRSLRMIVSAAPGSDDLGIDLLDATHSGAIAALDGLLDGPSLARPDAIFFTDPVDDPRTLGDLAELAARHHVPITVEIPGELAAADVGSETLGEIPEAWAELRARSGARWLCAVINPPTLVHEPAPDDRLGFGGAAAAVGAMAAASIGRTAAPGDVFGKSGMLVAPAAHETDVQGQRLTIPTAHFCSVTRQRELASRGVTALGSEPGRPELRLAAAPTVGSGADDPQLPGRILLGRAARLVRAVRDELPPGAGSADLDRALAEASATFLPKAGGAGVALRVKMDGDKLAVDGSIGAALAGAAFEFSSDV